MLYEKGYIFRISKFTQLGNSLIQLCNAINVGIQTRSQVVMPSIGTCLDTLDFLKDIPTFDFRKERSCNQMKESKFFFTRESYNYTLNNRERRDILASFVSPHLSLVDYKNITDETLVIHIRSGDIFGGWTHENYVQPPLSFYQKVIEESGCSDILIVTQPDKRNPCIGGLLSWNKDIRVQCGSLREDVSAILNAKNLVIGFGTFGWMLTLLSSNIDRLYCPEVVTDLFSSYFQVPPFSIKRYKFPNYIEIGDWKNTEDQRKKMVSYSMNKIGEAYADEY